MCSAVDSGAMRHDAVVSSSFRAVCSSFADSLVLWSALRTFRSSVSASQILQSCVHDSHRAVAAGRQSSPSTSAKQPENCLAPVIGVTRFVVMV